LQNEKFRANMYLHQDWELYTSFVPVIPGGKSPPKAASIAWALSIYNSKHVDKYVEGLTYVFKTSNN